MGFNPVRLVSIFFKNWTHKTYMEGRWRQLEGCIYKPRKA